MQSDKLAPWRHQHDFTGSFDAAESRTRKVLWLTLAMMVIEVAAGLRFHSMALFADGCHMGTHVAAFTIAALAYYLARKHAGDERYSFGTGKIGVLGAYTSAIILGMIGIYMLAESLFRLVRPAPIEFGSAIPIACLGLAVNIASALLLGGGHHHDHGMGHDHGHAHDNHDHGHDHPHGHEQTHGDEPATDDLNLRSAYVHVIADAVTSVLAIGALTCGKLYGWMWLDPVCGLVGGLIIGQWALSLIGSTRMILLDREPDSCDLRAEIRKTFDGFADTEICDLHIWQVGVNRYSAIVSIVTPHPEPPSVYKGLLSVHEELQHVTIEVNECEAPLTAAGRT